MKQGLKIFLLVLAFAALLAGAFFGYRLLSEKYAPDSGSNEEELIVPAPDFTVQDLNGNSYKFSDFAGKPVVLNFWATWCGPCKSEMPHFEEAYKKYGNKINFLMVNLTDGNMDTPEKVRQFIAESGYSFPVYLDTEYEGAYSYGVSSVPLTVFVYSNGIIHDGYIGAMSKDTLYGYINELLEIESEE